MAINDDKLDYIDQLLLNQVAKSCSVNDMVLAQKLHCSRSYIMSHLERLVKQEYLICEEDTFFLTEKGMYHIITLTGSENQTDSALQAEKKTFRWDFVYIPSPGWDQE